MENSEREMRREEYPMPVDATGEIVLYQPDADTRLDVHLMDETVWLTQAQLCELFQKVKSTISYHINNIFHEGELDESVVVRKIRTTTQHGAIEGKTQDNCVTLYNLDVIISVGYRIKSLRGTQFRIWATSVLKQYLLQGYAVNHQIQQVEYHLSKQIERHTDKLMAIEQTLQQHQEQINFFVRTNQPPHEGVVFQGHLLEGREVAENLISSATSEVILIDTYVGPDTFHILEARVQGVRAVIYTEKVGLHIQSLQVSHEAEYGHSRHIDVFRYSTDFHDRFLIIDDDVYHFGASLKDLGKRLFAFDKMGLSKALILSQV